jgi:hypothetical protein
MTDQEINRRLALAIGWEPKDMRPTLEVLFLMDRSRGPYFHTWEAFDYRDWRVIGPIAERYNCFPWRGDSGEWVSYAPGYLPPFADTPQEAIALAVIEAHEAGVLK